MGVYPTSTGEPWTVSRQNFTLHTLTLVRNICISFSVYVCQYVSCCIVLNDGQEETDPRQEEQALRWSSACGVGFTPR